MGQALWAKFGAHQEKDRAFQKTAFTAPVKTFFIVFL